MEAQFFSSLMAFGAIVTLISLIVTLRLNAHNTDTTKGVQLRFNIIVLFVVFLLFAGLSWGIYIFSEL